MSLSNELDKLSDLHRRGVLSDGEFSCAKARVLLSAGGGEQIDAISGPLHGGIERLCGDTEQGEDLELQAG